MNWITYSLLMFISSVALYLLIRKAQLLKIPYEIYSLFMFLIPGVMYLMMSVGDVSSLILPWNTLLLIFAAAFFFSYLGNLFSMKGVELAPNPGYSLTLSKSYVIFTSIVAVFLFQSHLDTKSIVAIFLIIGFSILIGISKKTHKSAAAWILYSMGAFFCWGGFTLMSKYLGDIGVTVLSRLTYVGLLVTLFLIIELKLKKIQIKRTDIKQNVVLLSLIGILSMLFNLFMQYGFETAPNPGYINAINASSISLLTLLSAYFFKDELNLRKMIGVIGVTIGMILLFI